jgi:hypothetical protein
MNAFGPHYPQELQRAVDDAERLAEVFSLPELGEGPHETWVIGRAAEIEQFVEAVAEDWRRGRIAEGAAAASIDSYVGGLRERLGLAASRRSYSTLAGADEPPTWT